ncbi:MAG: hypothetical protein ACLFQV_01960 [Vulcanimicrobiota bacterium]
MSKEYFVEQIVVNTGLNAEDVYAQIKEIEPDIDVEKEKELGRALYKFAKIITWTDRRVEEGLDIPEQEVEDVAEDLMYREKVTEEEKKEAEAFFKALKEAYGDEFDETNMMPSNIKRLIDGIYVIDFNKAVLFEDEFEEKVEDLIENEVMSRLFLDITPEKKGMRTFYYHL